MHYAVTPQSVELNTKVSNYRGPLRYIWHVLADDGKTPTTITVNGSKVSVSQDGGKTAQTFNAINAKSVRVEEVPYSNHNGWARIACAKYPSGGSLRLIIGASR